MIQGYPQIGSDRRSGEEDEWRILIRWKALAALVWVVMAVLIVSLTSRLTHYPVERTRGRKHPRHPAQKKVVTSAS